MSKLATSNVNISLHLLSPIQHDPSRSMRLMGVDDCPGMTPWNVSCTGVKSFRLRLISMKVFLMMRFSEAPLSIRVLATLCRPTESLTTKGMFRSDSSVSGWSFGLNEISTSNHFIFLPESMRWAKMISHSSFFSCAFEVMGMLPLKITLISPIWSSLSGSTWRCSPQWGSWATGVVGGGIFLRSGKVLHSSRLCRVVRWILHHFSASVGWWNNLFSFWSEDCYWQFPWYLRSPWSLRSLQSPWSVVLTSQSSCLFFEGPLLRDSRSLNAYVSDYK
jgi:hypothetical protein